MADKNTTDESHPDSKKRKLPVTMRQTRKRPTNYNQRGSGPNCSCRNSTCLNLDCECFVDWIYCNDSCSCENCFNERKYEDEVEKAQGELLSDNPPARIPNVGDDATQTPGNVAEGGTSTNPAESSRIRGCNCKNSMCLNQLCACFVANVGCSGGCGCEGCNNSFGIRTESEQQRIEVDIVQSETGSNQQQVEANRVESETGSNQQQVDEEQKKNETGSNTE